MASESGGSRVPELASLSADEYDVSLKNVNGVPYTTQAARGVHHTGIRVGGGDVIGGSAPCFQGGGAKSKDPPP